MILDYYLLSPIKFIFDNVNFEVLIISYEELKARNPGLNLEMIKNYFNM